MTVASWVTITTGSLPSEPSTAGTASSWSPRAPGRSGPGRWRDGSPVASGLPELPSPIADMVAFADADEIVVLTLHENGELRRTTLGAAIPPQTIARHLAARGLSHDIGARGLWLISYAGQQAVVATTRDDVAEVLSVADGHPIGLSTISVGKGWILTAANIGERILTVVATALTRTEVTVWDLNTGTLLGSPFRAERIFPERPKPVWAAMLAERGGAPRHAGRVGGRRSSFPVGSDSGPAGRTTAIRPSGRQYAHCPHRRW